MCNMAMKWRGQHNCFETSAAALIEAAAASVGLVPVRAKYSRASFLFPEQQVTACTPNA